MNTVLNITGVLILTNNSGVDLIYGDVVVLDSTANNSVITTNSATYTGSIGVVIDPGGVADGDQGAFAFNGYVPKVNLTNTATRLYALTTSSTPAKGVASASASNSFGIALTDATATPEAYLFGRALDLLPTSLSGLATGDLLRYNGSAFANVPADVSVRLTKSGTQAVSSGVTATVTWDVEDYDTASMYDGGNPSRITIPVTGKYLVIAGVAFGTNAVTALSIRVDGTTEIARQAQGNSNLTEGVNISTISYFTAGQYVEARFTANANNNIQVSNTHFEASLISR